MVTKKFKTNLKCDGCVAAVMPFLDAESTIDKWEVDLASPDKVLTVEGEAPDTKRIVELMRAAGYEARESKSLFRKVFGKD